MAVAESTYQRRERPLQAEEKARLGILVLPTFALAFSITMVSTYLGEVSRRYTQDAALIGLIIGGEGVMALWVPVIAGSWSDHAHSRLGGRLPFVIAGAIPAAVAMALIGFVRSLGLVALVAGLFFAFYFVAYEPYRAMYPDLIDAEEVGGRAQSTQALGRGLGTGCALLGGGLLLSVARPLPFFVAGVILLVAVSAFVVLTLHRVLGRDGRAGRSMPSARGADRSGPDAGRSERFGPIRRHAHELAAVVSGIWRLVRQHPALRAYFFANALWEMALAALKAFIVLYLTVALHFKLTSASLIIGGVAVVILLGAGVSGELGDRFGHLRVIAIASWFYGLGYLVLVFTTSKPVIAAAIPFVALGGGTLMTLAYAVLMPLMPADQHGTLTGYYSVSRGVGIVLGPILAGGLIELTKHHGALFASSQGFQAMWVVCAAAAFGSLPFLAWLRRASADREELARH